MLFLLSEMFSGLALGCTPGNIPTIGSIPGFPRHAVARTCPLLLSFAAHGVIQVLFIIA